MNIHTRLEFARLRQKAGLSYVQAQRRLRNSDDSIREALGEDIEPTLRKLLGHP